MDVDAIVAKVLEKMAAQQNASPASEADLKAIPVGVSNRHVHLSQHDAEALFGRGYSFKKLKDLSQPGQYACEECVTLVGSKGVIEKVRLLGPERTQTQVEILQGDCRKLGIPSVLRDSGKLEGTPGVTLCGPKGCVSLNSGVMVAKRHIHMTPEDAEARGLKDGDRVELECKGERGGILGQVLVRVTKQSKLDCHLDVEEASALGLKDGDTVIMIKNGR